MSTINDLDVKRGELNTAVDDYKQDQSPAVLEAAKTKGYEYAKLTAGVKRSNPTISDDDLFSDPIVQSASRRSDVATVLLKGKLLGIPLKLLIDTEANVSGETTGEIPFGSGSNVVIDWGNSTPEETHTQPAYHTYDSPGQYTVKIHGLVNGFESRSNEYSLQFKDVMQWGDVEFESANAMFMRRHGFTISASDAPNFLPGATTIAMFFQSGFNEDISHWDMSNVVNIDKMFYAAESFNQPLNDWDVSGVTSMREVFNAAYAFNQPLDRWDTSNVTNMYLMFNAAHNFNQSINSWNVGNVTNMYAMFNAAYAFNQPLDRWDTSNVTNMGSMFRGDSNFYQDLSMWNVAKVTNAYQFVHQTPMPNHYIPNFT